MKIGVFSDLHLKYAGDEIEGMDALKKIVKFFKEKEVEGIIFNGDFFEKRYRIHFNFLYQLVEVLWELRDMSFLVFNIGNHDLYEKTGAHALKFLSLSPNVTLIEEPRELEIAKGIKYKFFPYRKEVNEDDLKFLEEGGDILFAHQYMDIPEEKVIDPQEFVLNKDILKKYKLIIAGHYHIPFTTSFGKSEKDFHYILNLGSARSIDFKDAEGGGRFVYVLDTEKKKFEECDLEFPRHIKIQINSKEEREDFLKKMKKENHYQVTLSDKLINGELEEKENVIIKREQEEIEVKSRLELGEDFKIEDALPKYVSLKLGEDNEELQLYIQKGKELIKESENA